MGLFGFYTGCMEDKEPRRAGSFWVYDMSTCQDESYMQKRDLLIANEASLGDDGHTWYSDHAIPDLFEYLRGKREGSRKNANFGQRATKRVEK